MAPSDKSRINITLAKGRKNISKYEEQRMKTRVDDDVKRFLAGGGQIEHLDPGQSRGLEEWKKRRELAETTLSQQTESSR